MFTGRKEELAVLSLYLGQSTKNALLLYGKRRVGKSTLILKAADATNCKVVYFECLQSSLENNLRQFESKLKTAFNNKYLHFDSFTEAFDYLGTLNEKVIIILDEYPYLKEVSNGKYIDSLFQTIIDQMSNNIDLVLLGSYVSMMKELIEQGNPLFGRFSLVMKVNPFDYYESSLFYANLAAKQKVEFYSVFGGLPFANVLLNTNKSLQDNIIHNLLNPNSPLRLYVENILLAELSKVAPANMILKNLANGKKKYGELDKLVNMNTAGALDKQLKNLIDMEVIRKVYPINKPNDKKKTFYEISDNLVRFYYAYIYAQTDILAKIGEKAFYDLYISKSINTFIAHRFEEIAREYFIRKCKAGKLQNVYDIGTFWYDNPKEKTNGEFDCALKLNGGYTFYEVKYQDAPLSKNIMLEEALQITKTASFINVKAIGFISLAGHEEKSTCYQQIAGDELYII